MLIGTAIFIVINCALIFAMDSLSPLVLIIISTLNALCTTWLDKWLQR